jgi:RimJ/RimL family protein N-acetyltransferase
MLVRDVRWSDFDDLREMYYRLYDERERGAFVGITLFESRPSLPDEVAWFTRAYSRMLSGDLVMTVAEVDGRAVGHCSIGREGPLPTAENGHVGVLGILVDERYRGRGVGTALLDHSLQRAREKFDLVRLAVFSENDGARRLYARFGFVVCGRFPRMIRRGERYYDSEEMVLDFAAAPTGPAKG